MYGSDNNNESSSLAVVSSVLFPYHTSEAVKRRNTNVPSLPGAWIDDQQEEEQVSLPPKLTLMLENHTTTVMTNAQDIEYLKQTIANLRLEKDKLEETNTVVKKSIQIVAKKRLIAHQQKKSQKTEEDDDIYIVVASDFVPPTQEEMKKAGLEGWEWISAF